MSWCCIILLVRGQVNKEAMANIDPKSVTPAERVSTFPGEPLTVSKLFCEYSLQRRPFLKRACYRVPWEVGEARHECQMDRALCHLNRKIGNFIHLHMHVYRVKFLTMECYLH